MKRVEGVKYCAAHDAIVQRAACHVQRNRENKTRGACDVVALWCEPTTRTLFDVEDAEAGS